MGINQRVRLLYRAQLNPMVLTNYGTPWTCLTEKIQLGFQSWIRPNWQWDKNTLANRLNCLKYKINLSDLNGA